MNNDLRKVVHRQLLATAVAVVWLGTAASQTNPNFNVRLVLNFESAEKTIGLYEGLTGRGSEIAQLRGSQIATATTGLLAQQPLASSDLEKSLEAIKYRQLIGNDVFRLKEARENVAAIKELLAEIKHRNFAQRVTATVEQLFPATARINTSIPVYIVAFGHHNIDAYVRRVSWRGDTPVFVGEGEGELTIVVNLAKAVYYGRNADERFVGTLSVVAHEAFHAAFGVYKDTSPSWKAFYAERHSYLDALLDLTQNEGIAYYLSFEQRTGGYLPNDWDTRVRASFGEFNKSAGELLSTSLPPARANELIQRSNTAGFWESYGAITGLFIARQIDRSLGRAALVQTVADGPVAFFRTYTELERKDNNLPTLSAMISHAIGTGH
jgi:hypothetical protein